MSFTPNYQNIVDAARNIQPKRLPLYDHTVSDKKMEEILNCKFVQYLEGPEKNLDLYFQNYCRFFREMGYDTVSYEVCVGDAMPGSGALGKHADPIIKCREDFDKYPWDVVEDNYFNWFGERFESLRRCMPEGMKAIGGVGNGVFECVQELVGYMDLCYIRYDDEELYADLFQKIGDILVAIWTRFLKEYGDIFCVCRFGDDLGFKSATLLPPEDIETFVIPQYQRIVEVVHQHEKPFLLHSCGCIFDVMESLIEKVKIDAKHSNEDQIAPFSVWFERYGSRIGNFGGIDTDVLCQNPPEEIKKRVLEVIEQSKPYGGFALGSGNSIPDYVPAEGYLAMVNTVREYRGD